MANVKWAGRVHRPPLEARIRPVRMVGVDCNVAWAIEGRVVIVAVDKDGGTRHLQRVAPFLELVERQTRAAVFRNVLAASQALPRKQAAATVGNVHKGMRADRPVGDCAEQRRARVGHLLLDRSVADARRLRRRRLAAHHKLAAARAARVADGLGGVCTPPVLAQPHRGGTTVA